MDMVPASRETFFKLYFLNTHSGYSAKFKVIKDPSSIKRFLREICLSKPQYEVTQPQLKIGIQPGSL